MPGVTCPRPPLAAPRHHRRPSAKRHPWRRQRPHSICFVGSSGSAPQPNPRTSCERRRLVQNEAAAPADALAKKKERDENAAAEAPGTLNETVSVGAAPAVLHRKRRVAADARNDAPSEPAPAQLRIEQRKAVEERMAAAAPAAAPATPPAPAPSTAAAAGGRAAAADRATALKPELLSRVVAVAEIRHTERRRSVAHQPPRVRLQRTRPPAASAGSRSRCRTRGPSPPARRRR